MYELLPSIHLIELVSLPEIAELKTVFWTIGLILFIFQYRHWVSRSSDNLWCLFEVGRVSSDIWNFAFFWQDLKFAFKWLDFHLFLFLLFHRSKNEWVFKQWHIIQGFTFHFCVPSFQPKAVFWIWTNVDFISVICLSIQASIFYDTRGEQMRTGDGCGYFCMLIKAHWTFFQLWKGSITKRQRGCEVRKTWVWISNLPFTINVTLARLFSKLHFYDFKMYIVILTFVGNLQDSRKDMITDNWDICPQWMVLIVSVSIQSFQT